MPDAVPPPAATPQPAPDVVASRLQARFEGLADGPSQPTAAVEPPPPATGRIEPGAGPRGGARSGDKAAQRQLDDLQHQLLVLREQLDVAFDELDQRLELAETRASVAETRASVAETRASMAETRAAEAEARAHEALELVTAIEHRLSEDASGGEGGGNLRGAFDRLRSRLDTGSG